MTSRNPRSLNIARSELTAQRDALVSRLTEGDRQIQLARTAGTEVGRLETLWIRILREYETVCRALDLGEFEALDTAA